MYRVREHQQAVGIAQQRPVQLVFRAVVQHPGIPLSDSAPRTVVIAYSLRPLL